MSGISLRSTGYYQGNILRYCDVEVLLRHGNGDITTHYSAPELDVLLETADGIFEGTSALVILKK